MANGTNYLMYTERIEDTFYRAFGHGEIKTTVYGESDNPVLPREVVELRGSLLHGMISYYAGSVWADFDVAGEVVVLAAQNSGELLQKLATWARRVMAEMEAIEFEQSEAFQELAWHRFMFRAVTLKLRSGKVYPYV